jgi:hydrogenase nickel incorporation protein HypA/HybF
VKVNAVHLRLGPLSGVVKEPLLFAYELACEGTPLKGSRLTIEEVPILVYCPTCQTERPIASIQRFCCSACETPTPAILQGKELEISAMEIQE